VFNLKLGALGGIVKRRLAMALPGFTETMAKAGGLDCVTRLNTYTQP
jgi:hypothetical protein